MHSPRRADPALFPDLEFRVEIEDGLTRMLAGALAELPERPVMPDFDPDAFSEALAGFDFAKPHPLAEMLSWTVRQMQHGLVHVNHPRYFGLFNPAPAFPAECADRIAAAFNPQLATMTTSPTAVRIENHVIAAVGRRVGYADELGGHFTSGGSEANYTAMLCALTRSEPAFAAIGTRGFAGQPLLYVSRECHLAWVKIAHQSGIGRQAVRFVDTDGGGRLDAEALQRMIREDVARGDIPVMIVATAGTTNAGMIDPITACADVAEAHGMWLHVDAAWGGALITSDRQRHVLAGIERADSVTIDAHKWLSTTMGCGMFLTPHPSVAAAAFHVTAGFMPSNHAGLDPYVTSAQWSRRFSGLRMFLALATAGWCGYARVVDSAIELAEVLKSGLVARGWTVLNDSPVAVVCAQPPTGAPPVSDVVGRVQHSAQTWCSTAMFEGREVVRACISNATSTVGDIRVLLDELDRAAQPQHLGKDSLALSTT